MRYHLYISDAKLDMLYGQIPRRLRDKIAVELKIDLKIFGATVKEQPPQEVRYEQLNLVVEYLKRHEQIGTIAAPASWISGVEPMRWASIPSGDDKRGDLIMFGAKLRNYAEGFDHIVGLAGSPRHLIGNRGQGWGNEFYGGSAAVGGIVRHLGQDLAREVDDSDVERTDRSASEVDEHGLEVVLRSVGGLSGPVQSLEFLAKRLTQGTIHWQGRNVAVLLGTPLFVAMVD